MEGLRGGQEADWSYRSLATLASVHLLMSFALSLLPSVARGSAYALIYKIEFGNTVLGFRLYTTFHLYNTYIMLFPKISSFPETAKEHLRSACSMQEQCARCVHSPVFPVHVRAHTHIGDVLLPSPLVETEAQRSSHQPRVTQAFQW